MFPHKDHWVTFFSALYITLPIFPVTCVSNSTSLFVLEAVLSWISLFQSFARVPTALITSYCWANSTCNCTRLSFEPFSWLRSWSNFPPDTDQSFRNSLQWPSRTLTLPSVPRVLPRVPFLLIQVKLQETEIASKKLKEKDILQGVMGWIMYPAPMNVTSLETGSLQMWWS